MSGLAAILASSVAVPALAADYIEPPVIEAPPVVEEVYAAPDVGGWYIRGDIDYHWTNFRNGDYILYGAPGQRGKFDDGDLKGAMSLGAGIGYQVNDYFRVDLTGDYFFDADFEGSTSGFCGGVPCTSTDRSSMSAFLLLANAYVDLGTYHGFTPYVGAGIGGAHIKWDKLVNDDDNGRTEHDGGSEWRFAYAAMAGVSYCLTNRTKLDFGYRYSRIEGGDMFGYANNAGPGFDDGFDVHEVRGGLRYQFTGSNGCEPAPQPIAYEPPPVYKQ
ncbi:porin family protein [Mesorhizobium ephedrae]|jgi:opacity protein-like surface antigen|uniref:Porin family protein n=2 Tax=Kumtagia ephedrae TaxID=2116701 RepID=A0A2P7S485_9HYPH|nr:outer membrane protein [Mesorhizobium ephedrae]PSJ57275.1 porin family protein [Mesorhizobium ephedrae]